MKTRVSAQLNYKNYCARKEQVRKKPENAPSEEMVLAMLRDMGPASNNNKGGYYNMRNIE